MHSISLFYSLGLALVGTSTAALTYWVDPVSCGASFNDAHFNQRPKSAAIDEAFSVARAGYERLKSNTDTDFARIYEMMFHVEREDASALKKVTDAFKTIARAQETTDRKDAATRIYCDERRWKPKTDKEGNPVGGYKDTKNGMSTTTFECRDDGGPRGVTYVRHSSGASSKANKKRRTVTLCPRLFEAQIGRTSRGREFLYSDLFSDIASQGRDLSELERGIRSLSYVPTLTALHELFHSNDRKLLLTDPRGKQSYGWKNFLIMTADENLDNADTYATLGVWAYIAEGFDDQFGYTLVRDTRSTSQNAQTANAEAIAGGRIGKYQNITKRWLGRLARRSLVRGVL